MKIRQPVHAAAQSNGSCSLSHTLLQGNISVRPWRDAHPVDDGSCTASCFIFISWEGQVGNTTCQLTIRNQAVNHFAIWTDPCLSTRQGASLGLLARAILTQSTCMSLLHCKSEKQVQRKNRGSCLLPEHSYILITRRRSKKSNANRAWVKETNS